mmetsp:Transcript_82734/g.221863  ORF Transcript_82734/g.221863 Transcript_82734/m.221863 type:complete len:161 (-) Transcript_82734:1133-1615(-)
MRLSKPSLPQLFPLQASLVAPPPSQLGSFRDSGVGSVNGTAITVVSSFVVKADEKVFSCTSNLATKCGANANDANPTSSLDKSDELLGVANISPKQSAVTTPSSFGNSQFRRFYTMSKAPQDDLALLTCLQCFLQGSLISQRGMEFFHPSPLNFACSNQY